MMIWLPRGRDAAAHPPRRIVCWNTRAAGCLALTLLMMTACGRPAPATSRATVTAKPTATTTPANTLTLSWRTATVPAGNVFAIAPGDGDIAYACQVKSARRIAVSVTRDRAVHWTYAGDIALAADANQCFITVDGFQPTTVVVTVIWESKGDSPIIAFTTSYVSFDSGATWRKLTAPKPYWISQLTTLNGVIYGYMRVQDGEQEIPELAISRDQMRTWQPILLKISEFGGESNMYFWLNPASGALLARGDSAFWASTDAGAHWTRLAVPGITAQGEETIVQAPVAGQPWRLCAAGDDELNPRDLQPNTLSCSFDGGKTWQQEPGLNFTTSSVKGTFATPTTVYALASDGAALATASNGAYPITENEYRLMPGAKTWQPFADPPGGDGEIGYYPAPGGGVLWDSAPGGFVTASYP